MVVFTLFVGRLVGVAPDGIPYPLFVFAGLLPWTFFSNSIASAANSVVGNQNLVTKVYFPRLSIPISAAGVSLVDFAVAFGMLVILMVYFSVVPGWSAIFAPVILVLLATAALGIGILLAALTVAYRDFRHVVPFMIQLWMFATPSIYLPPDSSAISDGLRMWLPLNPAYGLIANFRAALFGGSFDLYALAVSGAVSVIAFVAGCAYFRRVERQFADII
jgi:lipopolysaccharide transport system permease protein